MQIRENKCRNGFHFKVHAVLLKKLRKRQKKNKNNKDTFRKQYTQKGTIQNKLIKNVLKTRSID